MTQAWNGKEFEATNTSTGEGKSDPWLGKQRNVSGKTRYDTTFPLRKVAFVMGNLKKAWILKAINLLIITIIQIIVNYEYKDVSQSIIFNSKTIEKISK